MFLDRFDIPTSKLNFKKQKNNYFDVYSSKKNTLKCNCYHPTTIPNGLLISFKL
jgi:hypothetical protein